MGAERDANKDVVARFFAALTEGRFDDAEAMVAPRGPWSIPRKRQAGTIVDQIALMRTEDMMFEVSVLTAEDDRVAALVHGVRQRPGESEVAKGYHFLIRVDSGRIADVLMYDDGGLNRGADKDTDSELPRIRSAGGTRP